MLVVQDNLMFVHSSVDETCSVSGVDARSEIPNAALTYAISCSCTLFKVEAGHSSLHDLGDDIWDLFRLIWLGARGTA